MSIELKNNQAALLLDIGADDSITLNVNAENMDGLAARLCIAMAKKLLADAGFQSELIVSFLKQSIKPLVEWVGVCEIEEFK